MAALASAVFRQANTAHKEELMLQVVLTGLSTGAIYGLVAMGFAIVFYVTRVMAFAASARITGSLYEDRTPIWPGKPGNPDPYPWRFEAEPEWVLDEPAWIPALTLADQLEHIRKWPREHWRLAFQGQLRQIGDADAQLLCDRLAAATAVTAA